MIVQASFVQDGLSIDHTPGSAVSAGDVVVQQNIVGIAKQAIAASKLGALAISGIFDVAKAEEAFATIGANVFWDADGDPYNRTAGTGCLTATPTGNTWVGFVLVAALSTDETVRIILRNTVSLTAEDFSLADLSDIGPVAYTAGRILVADGDSFEDVALSGHATLASDGTLTLTAWKDGDVAVAADALVIPVTKRHVSKTTGGDAEALSLADGVVGQRLTIDLVADGGGDGTLTPDTMTGFATIVFADAGDQVTLEFIDNSVGWVLVGAVGVAAPPVITI